MPNCYTKTLEGVGGWERKIAMQECGGGLDLDAFARRGLVKKRRKRFFTFDVLFIYVCTDGGTTRLIL